MRKIKAQGGKETYSSNLRKLLQGFIALMITLEYHFIRNTLYSSPHLGGQLFLYCCSKEMLPNVSVYFIHSVPASQGTPGWKEQKANQHNHQGVSTVQPDKWGSDPGKRLPFSWEANVIPQLRLLTFVLKQGVRGSLLKSKVAHLYWARKSPTCADLVLKMYLFRASSCLLALWIHK